MFQDLIYDLIPTYLERLVLAVGGAIGCCVGIAFGGHEIALYWFLAMMASDYLTGIYRACYLGEYQTDVCARGLMKKFCILWVCALANGLDVIAGTECIQMAFLGAFGLNEMLSMLENLGRVHPHFVPDPLQHFLSDLKRRGFHR